MNQWQPIETAPKDGQIILVFCRHGQYVCAFDTEEGWWYVDDNKFGPFPLRGEAPTHWMPLPDEPSHHE